MEALGLLAGGVAHDLNNILSGIVTLPEMMLGDNTLNESQRKKIISIKKTGDRATAIVSDLLTISRDSNTALNPMDLNRTINEYIDTSGLRNLKSEYPDITLLTELDDRTKNILGSSIHVQKILMNLLINAFEAIGQNHGEVKISTSSIKLKKSYNGYETIPSGEYSILKISNNGPEISVRDREKIFEPFYTKKIMGRSGTGIGLTLVWNTVKEHSGYIDILTSEELTTFAIFFPTTDQNLKDNKNEDKLQQNGNGEFILIVDDEAVQREILQEILIELNYTCEAVSSGEDAIEFVKVKKPDLIIMDMIMDPGINGKESFEKIKEIHPDQKAIIVSGYSETSDVKQCMRMGASDFIKKPYSIRIIASAIRKAL